MSRARHHVISRGYQRFFAAGEQIVLVDKQTRIASRRIGTADAFVEKHFNSWIGEDGRRFDELEDRWQELEDRCLPYVRRLIKGYDTPAARDGTKQLAAIHFGRSYGFAEVERRIEEQVTEDRANRAETNERLRTAFYDQYRREPDRGELHAAVRRNAERLFGGRRQLVESMARAHNEALDKFIPLSVQVVRAHSRRAQFVLGDQPVVYSAGFRIGIREQLALGDAQRIFMPISSDIAVAFTTRPEPDLVVPPLGVQLLNMQTWRAAARYVAGHPGTDFTTSTGYPIRDADGNRV